jgi:hypothetical protein
MIQSRPWEDSIAIGEERLAVTLETPTFCAHVEKAAKSWGKLVDWSLQQTITSAKGTTERVE